LLDLFYVIYISYDEQTNNSILESNYKIKFQWMVILSNPNPT